MSSPASAQESVSNETDPPRLGGVTVTDTAIDESYNRTESSSVRITRPLVDTPRSITVIPREMIDDRGFTTLVDVLRTTPGITLGSGEGGTPLGDRPFVRGYEASTDMLIDGIRNIGRFSHEVFNLDSVEVISGPGGALIGRGATGGTINLVTKAPRAGNFIAGTAMVGTDETKRITVDVNQQLSDSVAVRLNAMGHDANVAGRDAVTNSRYGFAPTVLLGLGGPLRATLSYAYLKTEAIPDVGLPFSNAGTETPLVIDRDNFYGYANRDLLDIEGQFGSAMVEYDLAPGITLRNSTRLVRTSNEHIFSRPSFNNTTATPETGLVQVDFRSGNRLNTGFLNQTDLRGRVFTGDIEHNFIGGIEYSEERQRNRVAWTQAPGSPVQFQDLYNPDPYAAFNPIRKLAPGEPVAPIEQITRAVFLFDTLVLSEQLEVNGGVRYDDYTARNANTSADSGFFNWQAGVVYKPLPFGSIYVSYGTSSNPPGECEGMAGGAEGAGACTLAGDRAALDPERAKSWELGTKWDVLDEQLSITAAAFQTRKDNARADDGFGGIALIGSNRVRGFEFGVAGSITPEWNVFGGYTYLDAVIRDDGAGDNAGNRLHFIAPHSANLWTTYDVIPELNVGAGVTYVGKRFTNAANTLYFDPYVRFDASLAYLVSDNIDLRLNIQNLAKKTYFDASHVGIFANVAPGRSALLSASLRY